MKQERILFICSGNTCRSVMAQTLFQSLKDNIDPGWNFRADSAGIHVLIGAASPGEAILTMARHGLDISTHRARQIDEQMLNNSLFILPMTNQQQFFLKNSFPKASHKIFLFRPFCYQGNKIESEEVEDPYGKGISFYEKLFFQLKNDITALIHHLREEKSR